jgi:hypothetical protein
MIKKPKKQFRRLQKQLRKRFSKWLRSLKKHHEKAPRHTAIIIFVIVIALPTGGIIYTTYNSQQSAGRLVTFHDRGKNHVILTNATTVQDALKDAHITVDPKDIVEPAITSNLLSTDSAVIIYRARPVLVIDGSFRERILTPAQSPNEIASAVGVASINENDKTSLTHGDFVADGASSRLIIERAVPETIKPVFGPTPQALTSSKGAQLYVDKGGVAHRETYYDLPMNIVIGHCSDSDYSIRYDGAKIDSDGYVLVAANYAIYPKCSVVETSLGPGKVYDTGGFALRYPHGFDLATDWTNNNGR